MSFPHAVLVAPSSIKYHVMMHAKGLRKFKLRINLKSYVELT